MRCLARNKQKIYYALFSSLTEAVDSNGNYTGEMVMTYETPVEWLVSVSPARGSAVLEQFGVLEKYQLTIVTDDTECPVDESAALWIGIEPTEAPNYCVIRVAKSLNSVTYFAKAVER